MKSQKIPKKSQPREAAADAADVEGKEYEKEVLLLSPPIATRGLWTICR